jgi:hypothetical protein
MSAQHTQKAAFVAGTAQEAYCFPVREIETMKRHLLKVTLLRREDGSLVVSPKRLSSARSRHLGVEMTGWCTGRDIPHASLFEALPPVGFRKSQINTWHAIRSHFWDELVAAERQRLALAPLLHARLRPVHLQAKLPGEGLLSVPTSDGPLEVERAHCIIEGTLCGTMFILRNVPICHPLVKVFVRRHRLGRDVTAMFDVYGVPQWSLFESGSAEEQFTKVLYDHLVPTGCRRIPEVHHGTTA